MAHETPVQTAPPVAVPPRSQPTTLEKIRAIFAIITMAVVSIAVVFLVLIVLYVFPAFNDTVQNMEKASADLARIADDYAAVSGETSQNIADSSANFLETSENFRRHSVNEGVAQTIIRLLQDDQQNR